MSKQTYLETIFKNFGSHEPPAKELSGQAYTSTSPLIRGRVDMTTFRMNGIKREAARALYDLTDTIYLEADRYRRGSTFNEISDAVFNTLMEFFDDIPPVVDAATVATIDQKLDVWFSKHATSTHLYIPCDITPYPSKPFTIGPIRFTHISDFALANGETPRNSLVFEELCQSMEHHHAAWMAEVDVHDCLPNRAAEVGDLAVDLALVALQLVIPLEYSENIARLFARRVPGQRHSVSVSYGKYTTGSSNQQPGRGFDSSAFEYVLAQGSDLLSAVGKRIDAFLNGNSTVRTLNQSWNDAAYWFHEGIAEPLNTIAVPKLETGVEVLLSAESSRGSEARIVQAIKTFYGLDSSDTLGPDSIITVKEFSKGLVRDRSRLLHGTWSTLATDMRNSRSSLTALSRELLLKFCLALSDYEAEGTPDDDIDSFLSWIEAKRLTTPTPQST